MAHVDSSNGSFKLRAYAGDFKTLLAFNLGKGDAANLAGFTVQVQPQGGDAYYLLNDLSLERPSDHAQAASAGPLSSLNAPFQKFRWLHVPGQSHQGLEPFAGPYTYTVTPRYFDADQSLQPLDPKRSASVTIAVTPFVKGDVELGFTRGFVQSQAFVNHFGPKALIQPAQHTLIFPTNVQAGANATGETFTYDQEWEWLGFTARTKIFDVLNAVVADQSLYLDMFAYDLSEPNVLNLLLALAQRKRVRLILDNSTEHHNADNTKPEDQFATKFTAAGGSLKRGKFARYAHDKILIVYNGPPAPQNATKVLTGSTNFSVTGMYVNSNHVVVFNDSHVASQYAQVFGEAWSDNVNAPAFIKTPLSATRYSYQSAGVPKTFVTYAPHSPGVVSTVLKYITDRIAVEEGTTGGSVLFAVMQLTGSDTPVYEALNALHSDQQIFSYGISDAPDGIYLYKPGTADGILVTGTPIGTVLPPPFSQVPTVRSVGALHQVHHKFVVCGFNGKDPTLFCGSSNLATGGEHANGDNLLEIHDEDIATAFAIEALALVDHFQFLNKYETGKAGAPKKPIASRSQAASDAQLSLSTTDAWSKPYFDPSDLHFADRTLFAG